MLFKEKLSKTLEGFSKALTQPLMYLAGGGMILAIATVFTQSNIVQALPFLAWKPISLVFTMLKAGIMAVINNLSILFCVGIAASYAKKEKHKAAIISLLAYLVYLAMNNSILTSLDSLAEASGMIGLTGTGQTTILGTQVLDMNVFGGILIGLLCGFIFNKTIDKKFKGVLQMYSGCVFTFMITILAIGAFSIVTNFVWPYIQSAISAVSRLIRSAGAFGIGLYGGLERLLIPTGLHHLIYTPFLFSEVGGTLQLGENTIVGAYPVAMTEISMNLPLSDSFFYLTGFVKMFGYMGICLSFIYTARKENRSRTAAMVVPLMITCLMATLTEPIDFLFMFAAPLLWVIHAGITGLFMALIKILDIHMFTNAGIIGNVLYNLSYGAEGTKWPLGLLLGIIQIAVYFVVFSFLIKKFNFKTPGREDPVADNATGDQEPARSFDAKIDVDHIIAGLGGKDNINTVGNCFTRLRVNVKDPALVRDEEINKTANSGIVKKGNDIQIIYGVGVPDVREAVEVRLNVMASETK